VALGVCLFLAMVAGIFIGLNLFGGNTKVKYTLEDDIRLLMVEGNVVVLDYEGNEIEIIDNMRIEPGYQIKMGSDSTAWIQINDDKAYEITENSNVILSDVLENDVCEVVVEEGKIKEVKIEDVPTIGDKLDEYQVGDTIFFGRFEQDNNLENGSEPIEWIILDKQEDRMLVISRYALDVRNYYSASTLLTWEKSGVRNWLNTEFYNSAFMNRDKELISLTQVNDNQKGTLDYLFLLNVEEAYSYFGDVYLGVDGQRTENRNRCVFPTAYALAKDPYLYTFEDEYWDMSGSMDWWLRSPGTVIRTASCVTAKGVIYSDGANPRYEFGIRPVMWISKNKSVVDKWVPYEEKELEVEYMSIDSSVWKKAYAGVINTEYNQAVMNFGAIVSLEVSYCLYDIDVNGVPELFMCTGSSYADRQCSVYSYNSDNGVYLIDVLSGFHLDPIPYVEDNTVVMYGGITGLWTLEKYRWTSGGLSPVESYLSKEEELYNYPDYKLLHQYEWSDSSGLDNWSGNPMPNDCAGIEWKTGT
ncbi:MAG: hypothetical protein HUJ56_09085, partial [Erysipelotrichaceae bacterium]|nr:hypothetical protein [Erysipelotrichaceae bacterium]